MSEILEPKIDPTWPWVLTEKTISKADKVVTKWTAVGMSTSQVSKIRIQYCNGKQLYDFRRGKPLEIEFIDAITTLTLTRQAPSRLKISKDVQELRAKLGLPPDGKIKCQVSVEQDEKQV